MEELITLQAEVLAEKNEAILKAKGYPRRVHRALYREMERRCLIYARALIANLA